ncbi:unnamed protein product, partial [Rotaria magnacalcarata]
MNPNTLANVIGEDLSRIFKLDMTHILVRSNNELNDRAEGETWTNEFGDQHSTRKLPTEKE